MKKLITILLILTSMFSFAQRVTDTDELIIRDSFNLNGDWFSLSGQTNGQIMQRINGRWIRCCYFRW